MKKIVLKNVSIDEVVQLYAKHGGKRAVRYFIKTGKLLKNIRKKK